MSRVRRNLGRSRRARGLGVALTITAVGVAACGGNNGDAAGRTAVPSIESDSNAGSGAGGEPIVIKSRVTFRDIVTGEVLGGSTIGDSPFCSGGTFRDREGDDIGSTDRTVRCSDGSLRIGLTTGTGAAGEQAGTWKIISGTGAYEGWQGSGQMEVKLKRGSDTKASETFTGTVAH